MMAHASATDELAWSLPENVAQPPFSMKELCCQELVFLSSVMLVTASALCWNLSTQMGARAVTRADGGALLCHLLCGAAGYPAAPIKAHEHGRDGADGRALQQTCKGVALKNWRTLHGVFPRFI